MWKLLIFGFTALMSYLWINGELSGVEVWVTLALIVLHIYKYIWPVVRNINNRNKRNKFIQFYQTLSRAEKDAASTLWEWDEQRIIDAINPTSNHWITKKANEERLFSYYNNLPADYETLRKEIKKQIKKDKKQAADNKKRRAENRAKNNKLRELARQGREIAAKKRKEKLIQLYGAENTKKILQKKVWQGMSEAMLKESLGRPVKQRKQEYKEIVKKNLFYKARKTKLGTEMPTFRVDLENGNVVGMKDLD